MPKVHNPLEALLAPEHADALRFALLLAYARGWGDAFGQPTLAVADARLDALLEEAGEEWHARMISRSARDLLVPPWSEGVRDAQS